MSMVAQKQPVLAPTESSLKAEAAARFAAQGLPEKSLESWRYTSLHWLQEPQLRARPPAPQKQMLSLPDVGHYRLVVLNGYPLQAVSALPEGLEICHQAEHSESALSVFDTVLQRRDASHISLNLAEAERVILLHLKEGVILDKPLEILYLYDDIAANVCIHTQCWLMLEAHAEATIIEHVAGDATQNIFHNHVNFIHLHKGTSLTHYRLQDAPAEVSLLASSLVAQEKHSRYDAMSVLVGGALSRHEVRVALLGEGAWCNQQGVVMGKGKQHHDAYLPVCHRAPHCYSNQHFRQLLDDAATGVFYGSVEVPEQSIKTEAHQLNKNILLSSAAQAFSRPELDILTDDVICSHGSTTGTLDAQALYYLQSRGLDAMQAKALLTQAFIAELLESIKDEYVKERAGRMMSSS